MIKIHAKRNRNRASICYRDGDTIPYPRALCGLKLVTFPAHRDSEVTCERCKRILSRP